MERVLPDPDVKAKIRSLAVGLASDCDAPERDVEKLMRDNLAGASTLPFVGLVSHDGKWVAGFSGYKDAAAFLAMLNEAEASPHLQASPAVRKKIAGLLARAGKSAERGDWKTVLKAADDASKSYGRCAERDDLLALVAKARAWAVERFDEAARIATAGGDLTEARKALGEVRKHFGKEPEGDEAETGLKAVQRLAQIVSVEARSTPPKDLREKAAAEYEGTRWAAIFAKQEEPPAPEPAEEEGSPEESEDIEVGGG